MKVCSYLITFIITFLTFINSGYANNKVPIGEKSSISIILTSIEKISEIDTKQKLYLDASKTLGREKDFDQFELMIKQLPDELLIYQRKLYEHFFLEYNKVEKLAVLKSNLSKVSEKNIIDYVVERLAYQALTEESEKSYDILLPLVSQNVIRSRVILRLIEYYLKNNQIDKANQLIEGIAFPGQKDSAFSLIAIGYAKVADYERCNINLNNIIDSDIKQNSIQLVLNEFIKKSMYKISFELLNRISDQTHYEEALIILMNQYVFEEKYDTAYQLFQSIKSAALQQEALYNLAIGFAKNADSEGLDNVLDLIAEDDFKDKALHDSVQEFAKLGLAEEAVDYALSIKNYSLYESALIEAAAYLGASDNTSFVILKLQQINEVDLFNKCLENYSYSLVKNLKSNDIEKVQEYIKDNELKQVILLNSLKLLVETNQFNKIEPFENKIRTNKDMALFLLSYSKKVYDEELIEYYDLVLSKIKQFIAKEKLEFFYEASLLLMNANIEYKKSNFDEVASVINEYDNQLLKLDDVQFDNVKKETLELLISINKDKQALQIIDSYGTVYEKMSYLFLFNNKMNFKEQTVLNKQILSFTKKIIK